MNGRDASERGRPGPAAVVMIAAIRVYQLSLSFLLGRHCRHLPTCSDYAMEAIGRHGAWAGFWLGLFRVARCHPFGTHGFDPPPDAAPRHDLRIWRYARYGRRP
jgi:uncharacterized protein